TPSSSWCSTLPAGRLFHGVPGSIPAIGGCMPPCSSTPPHPKLRPMKTDFNAYLVGGAVRDQLLGEPWHERDWVVVCAAPDQRLERGSRPVGQDVPAFLHPDTGEEYALARPERQSGHGYGGFTFHADPSVTLEEDLQRRDRATNALAMDDEGQVID